MIFTTLSNAQHCKDFGGGQTGIFDDSNIFPFQSDFQKRSQFWSIHSIFSKQNKTKNSDKRLQNHATNYTLVDYLLSLFSSKQKKMISFRMPIFISQLIPYYTYHYYLKPLRLLQLHCNIHKNATSDHQRSKEYILRSASRSGIEDLSHHRGQTDFEFQTGNSLITLQK